MKKNTSKSDVVKAKSNHPTSPDRKPLTTQEQADFKKLEKVIDDNYDGSFKLAAALAQIHDGKLYRDEFDTWEEYCKERWQYSRSYCLRLANVNEVMTDLKKMPDAKDAIPRNECQARVFVDLETQDRMKLLKKVAKEIGKEAPTASLFSKYKKELFPDKFTPKPKLESDKPVIDVESSVVDMPKVPSLLKLVGVATEMHDGLVKDGFEGDVTDLLELFLKEAAPWVEWEKKQAKQQ